MNLELWEILVPTRFGDDNTKVEISQHQLWDGYVHNLSGGLTILKPVKGQWIEKQIDQLITERMIPVRIATYRENILQIIDFTLRFYRQKAVMAYRLSDEVIIKEI